jgi:hypothetical protein
LGGERKEENMAATYLATTFSPMMLSERVSGYVREITLAQARDILQDPFTSAVGHEVTAEILSALLDRKIEHNRINLVLKSGDQVVCIIPKFRAEQAREFTREEVEAAGYRCFQVLVAR